MNRNDLITIAFQIRKEPKAHDISAYLYDTANLIKHDTSTATLYAAHQLVHAIRETNPTPSEFCKERMQIIETAYTQRMTDKLETLAKCYESLDYEKIMQSVN